MKQRIIRQFMHPSGLAGRIAGRVMSRKNRDRNRWVVGRLEMDPHSHVLEIGHGPGVAIELLLETRGDCTITAIDPSKVMHAQARRLNREAVRRGEVRLRCESADDYEGGDAPFDLVFSVNSLPFCGNPEQVVARSAQWLKPGRVIIAHQPPLKARDETSLSAILGTWSWWLTAAGLAPGRKLTGPGEPNPVLMVEGIRTF